MSGGDRNTIQHQILVGFRGAWQLSSNQKTQKDSFRAAINASDGGRQDRAKSRQVSEERSKSFGSTCGHVVQHHPFSPYAGEARNPCLHRTRSFPLARSQGVSCDRGDALITRRTLGEYSGRPPVGDCKASSSVQSPKLHADQVCAFSF
ncbi:unnamed protein product [Symbiodinium natans]|uniref:Uncharacterized protein n=1 Tax=Symbiodinium natans TaxID=878477 RepID=A0A812VAH0_9DINO|nr:unnamed protein product [Symbiodinium natans]